MEEQFQKRCGYRECENPTVSSQFYDISATRTSGGQDWSSLAGSTICNACYCRFKRNGTLDRAMNKPLPKDARKCSFYGCERRDEGCHFYEIVEGQTAGGQDWSSLAGSVLCNACYLRFWKWGTLERQASRKRLGVAVLPTTKPAPGPPGERVRRATRAIPGKMAPVKRGVMSVKKQKHEVGVSEGGGKEPPMEGALDMLCAVCAQEGEKT